MSTMLKNIGLHCMLCMFTVKGKRLNCTVNRARQCNNAPYGVLFTAEASGKGALETTFPASVLLLLRWYQPPLLFIGVGKDVLLLFFYDSFRFSLDHKVLLIWSFYLKKAFLTGLMFLVFYSPWLSHVLIYIQRDDFFFIITGCTNLF